MSPKNKKKLIQIRNKLDKLDNQLLSLIKHRTILVNNVIKLKEPKQIFPAYKKALDRKDNVSTIFVEYGDYYNEK